MVGEVEIKELPHKLGVQEDLVVVELELLQDQQDQEIHLLLVQSKVKMVELVWQEQELQMKQVVEAEVQQSLELLVLTHLILEAQVVMVVQVLQHL